MCNCKESLKLISYKWNGEYMIYKYKCENCDEEKIMMKKFDEDELKEMLYDPNLYNNL